MTSVQIIPGAPYNIQSPYVPGGLLQFGNITAGFVNATLGNNMTSLSQQWTFQPVDATNTTYAILNVGFNTSYITAASGSPLLVSNSGTQTWYLRPIDAVYHSICYNAECSLVWAPWAEVGGPLTATEDQSCGGLYQYHDGFGLDDFWNAISSFRIHNSQPDT
ncbi:hypothetical protein MD484_g6564, partial [Candolleomyces efflorescens]